MERNKLLKTDGNLKLYEKRRILTEYKTSSGSIFNTLTNENVGTNYTTYFSLYDEDGNKLDVPINDENSYEIREVNTDE